MGSAPPVPKRTSLASKEYPMADDSFRIVAKIRVHPGQLETFKRLVRDLTASVEAEEPGTRAYEWYLSADGENGYFHEWLASSEAFLAHLAHVGPTLPPLHAVAPITQALVFGNPSDQVKEALASFGAEYFPHVVGFSR
jgi:quinol monooxygenase YgiN